VSEAYRLSQALAALHGGITSLRGEDGDLNIDVDALLPDEAADVETALLAVLRAAQMADAMADMAATMAANTKDRADRYKRRRDRLRGIAFAAMDALDKKRIEAPDLTASIAKGKPSLLVTDENSIPDEYWRSVRSVDKTAVTEAIKQGVVVPGAEISNGMPSISIRSR